MESMVVPLIVGVLVLLLALGVHIGFALGLAGITGMLMLIGVRGTMANLAVIPYNSTALYSLAIVPMFVLMGAFFTRTGFTADAFTAAQMWLARIKGGLAATTVVACGVFGAVTGSSIANAAVFSRIAIPEMTRNGIDKRLAAGAVAASGTLASLIPPSLLIVIFGIITDQSIRLLLIAGILPGIVSILIYIAGIMGLVRLRPSLLTNGELGAKAEAAGAPVRVLEVPRYTLRERLAGLRKLWGAGFVFGIVLGGIYLGWFTPTQAGAIGATAAFGLAFLPGRRIGFNGVWLSLRETGVTTGSIITILIGGAFMGRFLGYSGVIKQINESLLGLGLSKYGYLAIFALTIIALGMFLEAFAIMVIVLPVMYPLLVAVGFDPIVIGILTIKLVEIGLITPPVGLNAYVVKSASPVPLTLGDTFAGVTPFILLDLTTLLILVAFPGIILYLPRLAMG
jgi:C4-dicarboxylate transporter DctM subunit